jgi:hypothetical protein
MKKNESPADSLEPIRRNRRSSPYIPYAKAYVLWVSEHNGTEVRLTVLMPESLTTDGRVGLVPKKQALGGVRYAPNKSASAATRALRPDSSKIRRKIVEIKRHKTPYLRDGACSLTGASLLLIRRVSYAINIRRGAYPMEGEKAQQWRVLCEQATVEQDPTKTHDTDYRNQTFAGRKRATVKSAVREQTTDRNVKSRQDHVF